jgi:transposase
MSPVESGHFGCPRCAELEALLRAALGRVAELEHRVRELEARLNQNSSNSSRPPSSDPPHAPAAPKKPPTGRKPGGQPGHKGHHRTRLPLGRVDEVVDHVPGTCGRCCAALPFERQPHDPEPSWHQVAEVPPVAAEVTEHRGHARTCPCCGAVTRQPIPAAVRAHAFGPRLTALMGYLTGRCHDGRRVVEEFVEDVLGVPVSLGAVSNREAEAADALAPAYGQAAAAVRAAGCKNVDETGWAVGGEGRWLWVAACEAAAVFAVHARRSWEGLQAVLGPDPPATPGVVTSDRFPTYDGLPVGKRQVCWAHLLRDFTKWSEPGGHSGSAMAMGSDGRAVARKVLRLWRQFRAGEVGRPALFQPLRRLRERMGQVLRAGARLGQPRDAKAAAFCRNLLEIEPALWTFASAEGVEPTNNHAERCLRPAVLWRKNSFGSQSDRGCRFAERMLTVVTTLRLRGKAVLDYLSRAVEAHRAGLPAPSLLA